jgi:hypothetical protein
MAEKLLLTNSREEIYPMALDWVPSEELAVQKSPLSEQFRRKLLS